MLISARAQRWMKGGIVVSSVPFFLLGLLLIRTGVLFLLAPELLRELGFLQDASFGVRALGLLFLGGCGGLLAWCGWRLIRLVRRGLSITHAIAFGMIGVFANRIFGEGDPSLLDFTGLATSLFTVGYLSAPAVRSLFRNKGAASESVRHNTS